ncbi:MAG: hypothetical protein GQ477_02470 [Nanohaloarchaea archaeon]|nr:hypothetical protein [Candidatus Nanohaloarchaea archaeon]
MARVSTSKSTTTKKALKETVKSKTIKDLELRLEKNEDILIADLPWIQKNISSIMKAIAKYDRKSEQYLNSQFEKFEMYSKSIELDIESKVQENTTLLRNALGDIDRFLSKQEKIKQLDIENTNKEHRQIKADIKLIKEEFTVSFNQYKDLEKDLIEIRLRIESEFKEEDRHIVKLVRALKEDIKNIDNMLDSEKQKIKESISNVIYTQKKEFDKKIEDNVKISKDYLDANMDQLLKKIQILSSKNNRLIQVIEEKEKESRENLSEDMTAHMINLKTQLSDIKKTQRSNDSKVMDQIKTMDSMFDSEKQKIEESMAGMFGAQKKEFDKKIENNVAVSKEYMDATIEPLLRQIKILSSKNNKLVHIIETGEKESSKDMSEDMTAHMTDIKTQLSEFEKAQRSITDKFGVQEKEFDKKIENNVAVSKEYMDATIEPLLRQIEALSSKNNKLVHIIEKKEDESPIHIPEEVMSQITVIKTQLLDIEKNQRSNDSKVMDYINNLKSQPDTKYDNAELINRINALESAQKSNEALINASIDTIKTDNEIPSDTDDYDLTNLLETFKKRDDVREKRISNMFERIEQAVSEIQKRSENNTSSEVKNDIGDELDSMISDLKKLQQESN